MNIQMRGADEWIDGKSTGNLGEVLIRYVAIRLLQVAFGWPRNIVRVGSDRKEMHADTKPTKRRKNSSRTMLTCWLQV